MGQYAIRPVALVEQAKLHNEITINQGPVNTIHLTQLNIAHTEIAFNFIQCFAVRIFKADGKVIQKRLIRRPKPWRSYGQIKTGAANSVCHRNYLTAIKRNSIYFSLACGIYQYL